MAPRSAHANREIREERIKKIREAALILFSSKGYHNTSISEVAQKADMSKGLMYNYYDSKEALLKAIVVALIEESQAFARVLDKLEDPIAKIRATIEYSIEAMETRPEESRMLLVLFLQRDSMKEVSAFIERATRELIGYFMVILREAGVADPELETYLLVSALDGLGIHYVFFKNNPEYPWDEIKQKFVDNTLKHLKL